MFATVSSRDVKPYHYNKAPPICLSSFSAVETPEINVVMMSDEMSHDEWNVLITGGNGNSTVHYNPIWWYRT